MFRFLICLFGVSLLMSADVSPLLTTVVAAEDPAHDDGHHESGGHGAGEHGDAPSLPLDWKADLAIWSLIVFGLFVFVLKKFAWGPLIAGLDKREETLRNQAAETEFAMQKAQTLLAEHEKKLDEARDEVREMIAEARRDAEHTKQDILTQAQQEAEATANRAVDDINQARDVALKDLFDRVSGQVTSATEHVLGRSMSGDDHNRLIEEALTQFSDNSGGQS